VVAPNAFKGCLTAQEAAVAMARGVRSAGGEPEPIPVADGGDGTLDVLVAGLGGTVMGVIARGPLGLPVRAHLARLDDGTGIVEMAQASGYALVGESERDPLRSSSYGTGELLKGALARRPSRVFVALGGSATVDGGTGLARALGVRFLDESGAVLPDGGGALERLARIDATRLDPRVGEAPIVALADVTNPLLGPDGAARAYGPQKGATESQVEQLERGLERLAARLHADLGVDASDIPGAGAAGGAGVMLAALGAELRSGAEVVLEALGFHERIDGADLVVTGEGKLDVHSLSGKAPVAVARACEAKLVGCAAIVGISELPQGQGGFVMVRSLVEHFGDEATALSRASEGLVAVSSALVRALAGTRARALNAPFEGLP
jgi:glycerate kinase